MSSVSFLDDILNKIDGASSCRSKVKYSEASAIRAKSRMQQRKKEPFEHYKCRHCDHWHIGHPRFWRWTKEQKQQAGLD